MEDYPTEMTSVWTCTKEECNGWMRADYSFEDFPDCPQCHSPMVSSMKSLPVLVDSTYDLNKAFKKPNSKS